MGFSGRREAMSAPTVEEVTTQAATGNTMIRLPCSLTTSRERAQTTVSAHSNHASQVAAWVPVLPGPRSCSFVPSVTMPFYRIARLPNATTIVTKPYGERASGMAVSCPGGGTVISDTSC